jgi:hypothetical protein
MAKRDRRGSVLSRSKPRRAKKASVPRPGKSGRAGLDRRKKLTTQTVDSSVKRPIRTPLPTASSQSDAGMPKQRGRSGGEIRTPLPSPIAGELEEINLFGGRAHQGRAGTRRQSAFGQSDTGAPAQLGGTGGRRRTPAPLQILGELEEIDLFGRRARQNRPARRLEDKAGRFRNVQDFFHNPNVFELRSKELDTSSTPEEIEVRTGEVRYQIEVMRSLMTVLTEELKALEQARPLLAEQSNTSQS